MTNLSYFLLLPPVAGEVTSQIFGQRRSEADSWHLISASDLWEAGGVQGSADQTEAAGAERKAAGALMRL